MSWRIVAAAAVAGAIIGAFLDRKLAPKQVQVEYRERLVEKVVEAKKADVVIEKGPVRVVERWYSPPAPAAPGAPPAPQVVIRERVVERAAEHQERRTETARQSTRDESTDIRIVPTPPPSWAISGGLQLLPERAPVVQLGKRLIGPVWLELQVAPRLAIAPPAVVALVRVEF